MKNNRKSIFGGLSEGRGFYAAMALCLLGAIAAAWISVDRTVSSANEEENIPKQESRVTESEKYSPEDSVFATRETAKPKADVPAEEKSEAPGEKAPVPARKAAKFAMPVSGEIIGKHSLGELVKYEALGEWRTHDGIDIAADAGAEIKAAAEGKITAIRSDPLWGMTVEIDHGKGITGIYSGLADEITLKQGDEVKSGDIIGKLGETNLAEADKSSHLHFAMKENGKFIDPLEKLGK